MGFWKDLGKNLINPIFTGRNPTVSEAKQESIENKTKNQETKNNTLNNEGIYNITPFSQEMLEKQWAREDQIRKETQEREDTAYQRAVEDMQKAGINPNLVAPQPSASGGGITNSTGFDYNEFNTKYNANLQQLINEINNNVQIEENEKNRIIGLIENLIPNFNITALK